MGNTIMTKTGMGHCPELTLDMLKETFDNIDLVFFDCDGTLWKGDKLLAGAASTTRKLEKLGKLVGYMTNDSLLTQTEIAERLTKHNFSLASKDLIACNNHAMATYLTQRNIRRVFTVGNSGLGRELTAAGIDHFTTDADGNLPSNASSEPVGAVLCSLDETFNYQRMSQAAHYLLKSKTTKFIASNLDTNYPVHGRLVPGVGAIAASIATASEREVDDVIGKPRQFMFSHIAEKYKVDPYRVLVVGDRCDADMEFAHNIGAWSLLVLTGCSSLVEVSSHIAPGSPTQCRAPTCYLPNLDDFDKLLSQL